MSNSILHSARFNKTTTLATAEAFLVDPGPFDQMPKALLSCHAKIA